MFLSVSSEADSHMVGGLHETVATCIVKLRDPWLDTLTHQQTKRHTPLSLAAEIDLPKGQELQRFVGLLAEPLRQLLQHHFFPLRLVFEGKSLVALIEKQGNPLPHRNIIFIV